MATVGIVSAALEAELRLKVRLQMVPPDPAMLDAAPRPCAGRAM